jgi:APA family basic amino acid/polyamine antiporter
VLRKKRPDLKRSFQVPWSPFLPILSAVLCFWLMLNLTTLTWARFGVWLLLGFIVYFAYGRRHSLVGIEAKRIVDATEREELAAEKRALKGE